MAIVASSIFFLCYSATNTRRNSCWRIKGETEIEASRASQQRKKMRKRVSMSSEHIYIYTMGTKTEWKWIKTYGRKYWRCYTMYRYNICNGIRSHSNLFSCVLVVFLPHYKLNLLQMRKSKSMVATQCLEVFSSLTVYYAFSFFSTLVLGFSVEPLKRTAWSILNVLRAHSIL